MSAILRNAPWLDRDTPALTDDRQSLSWAECDAALDRAVAALRAQPADHPQRVAVFAANSVEAVLAFAAIVLAGDTAVPVNSRLTAAELGYILDDSQATIIFAGPETVATALAAAQDRTIHVVAWRSPQGKGWDLFLQDAPADALLTEILSAPMLQYTSGTTGLPKATFTPAQVQPIGLPIDALVQHFAPPPDARDGVARPHLLVSPIYHGLGLASVRAFLGGSPVVILDRFDAQRTLEAIETHRIDSMRMVPTHFQRLLDLPEEIRRRYDVSSLRFVAHSGSSCPPAVKRAMIDWFGPIFLETYGATEMGSAAIITSQEWLEHPGSVGRVASDLELWVMDDAGQRLGPDQTGRLYFKAAEGNRVNFVNDPEKTRSVFLRPGLFTMGDIGHVDRDGYIFITDRDADIVVSGGVNIYPAEADAALRALPGVADAACIGVPDDELGEILIGLVVPKAGERPDPADLLRQCQARIAKYKCPREIRLVDDIGRMDTGKFNRQALKRQYA